MDSLPELPYLIGWLAAAAAMFALFAIALTMLAHRMRVSGAWLAWVPGLNVFLICRLAGISYAFVPLFLVPGLNLLCAGYAGAKIAARRGRSAALGALLPVPVVGLLALFAVASGPATPRPSVGPTVCPACGSPDCVGEAFCGTTGQRLGPWPAQPGPPAPPAPARGGHKVLAAVLGLLIIAGLGFLIVGALAPGKRGAQAALSALPQRMAGTLKEFPVDTDRARAVRPSGLISQTYPRNGSVPVAIPAAKLPPWVPPQELPQISTGAAQADYRFSPQDAPISVAVLEGPWDGPPPPGAGFEQPSLQVVLVADGWVSPPLAVALVRRALPDAQITGVEVDRHGGGRPLRYRCRSLFR